jgi:hypothetical protein
MPEDFFAGIERDGVGVASSAGALKLSASGAFGATSSWVTTVGRIDDS